MRCLDRRARPLADMHFAAKRKDIGAVYDRILELSDASQTVGKGHGNTVLRTYLRLAPGGDRGPVGAFAKQRMALNDYIRDRIER